MKVLIVCPLHDLATVLSTNACSVLTEWIDQENLKRLKSGAKLIEYKILSGLKANRVALYLNRKIDALFYYGHGLKDRLGDLWIYFMPILNKRNIKWFKGKIIYTMSCFSGRELAPFAVENGVRAYFGQTTKYYGFTPSVDYRYLQDWYKLVNIIPISLMEGDSALKAMEKYDTFAHHIYGKYIGQRHKNAEALFVNALNMRLYGDRSARI